MEVGWVREMWGLGRGDGCVAKGGGAVDGEDVGGDAGAS